MIRPTPLDFSPARRRARGARWFRFLLGSFTLAMGGATVALARPEIEVLPAPRADSVVIANEDGAVPIVVDAHDFAVVSEAARLFADDVQRVSARRPAIVERSTQPQAVMVGTLGHSSVVDGLVASGKIQGLEKIKGRWEATLWQLVDQPAPGIERALVIIGSDRRGTSYGLMELSEKIGVSPWNWWADVPPRHAPVVAVSMHGPQFDAPAVKYRGIFINDEDWGLFPWAAKTFDPALGNIGPKTYEKVFELMLRLRMNTIWPAMHACSAEFASLPANLKLADEFGIVAGSSHCEPMLCNNIHWNEHRQGKWDYLLNRDAIRAYWKQSAASRGRYEAVWTLGIRGIHDAPMEGPPDLPTRLNIVSDAISDQRALLRDYATQNGELPAQCFVPYKEVLPIYDAGLKVPEDVTLVWVDDNFGYIRRLSAPAERARRGGAGVYWHLSYYGGPHSYTWINTTAPGLMWEELHKAWENDARTLWMLNVGDIKPAELGIDYFSRFAWAPDRMGPDSQTPFLHEFAAENFGAARADRIAHLLNDYYRLGTQRKPELMVRSWAVGLSPDEARRLERAYTALLAEEEKLASDLPAESRDAFTEIVGFPARVLATTGLIFIADRDAVLGHEADANRTRIERLRAGLEEDVRRFNLTVAGGKWNRIMPGLVTATDLTKWNSQVRWPWGEAASAKGASHATAMPTAARARSWRDAADFDRAHVARNGAAWKSVQGLGCSGHALALLPAALTSSWATRDADAPQIEFDFKTEAGASQAEIDFLPTFRIYPGMKARISVTVDDGEPQVIEVPGSSGAEDERGALRQSAVQDNFVRAQIPLPSLASGQHVLKIAAIDPGVVIDRVSVP